MSSSSLRGVRILAPVPADYATILTPEALAFVAHFARCYGKRVEALLAQREVVQARFDAGVKPDFLPETRHVRESEWQVLVFQNSLLSLTRPATKLEFGGQTCFRQSWMLLEQLHMGNEIYDLVAVKAF